MHQLNHLDYYRLPWNLSDNSIAWLEPTSRCNLACYGCYRQNDADGHKPLEEVAADLDVFQRLRNFDAVSIAGGDPLTHPEIPEIVRMVHERGVKPILNTNGLALTRELLSELKRAGAYGFTFHIDSKQNRPGWKEKSELELNELRYEYARMIADAGGMACAFNMTVYDDTRQYVPALLRWAEEHIDLVQLMVFILYRAIDARSFDFYAGPSKLPAGEFTYNETAGERSDIGTEEIHALIREAYPEFESCAYLNGSARPDSLKWLLSGRLGRRGRIYGYMGRKGIEIIQTFHHLIKGRYLAYASRGLTRMGRSVLALGLLDERLRAALRAYYRNPFNVFRRLYYQSIMVIQPIDLLEDGRQNMCDSCPDVTVWNGQLVWSCRMDEQQRFGCNVTSVPKQAAGRSDPAGRWAGVEHG